MSSMQNLKKERRRDSYAFESEKDLLAFFSNSLSKQVIKETIKRVKKVFILRDDNTHGEKKLQMIKKCEAELVRLTRSNFGVEP